MTSPPVQAPVLAQSSDVTSCQCTCYDVTSCAGTSSAGTESLLMADTPHNSDRLRVQYEVEVDGKEVEEEQVVEVVVGEQASPE